MTNKIMSRIREPSSWAGLGLLLMGVDKMFDVNEAGMIGETVTQAASTGDMGVIATALIGGIAAIFMREKGQKD